MKSISGAILIAMMILMAGCDPGMAIYQSNPSLKAIRRGDAFLPKVAVDVKTRHELIGERIYFTQIEITNSSDSSITVTHVELAAKGVTYANKPLRPGAYPAVVLPGGTGTVDVLFNLREDVQQTFKRPAELRVYYQSAGQEQVVHTSIVGGHLNDAPLR